MIPDSTSTRATDLGAAALEVKPAQRHRQAMSRSGTAISLPETVLGSHAEDTHTTSDCVFGGTADWVLRGTLHDEETLHDRPRLECPIDEEKAYRPDLYSDAFEVANDDLLLYDWEAEDLLEAGDTVFEIDELGTEAEDVVQPSTDMMSIDASNGSTSDSALLLLVPKAPTGPVPQGFVRKHKDVLIFSPPAKKVFEPEAAFAKVPQGSALSAVAALRSGDQSGATQQRACSQLCSTCCTF